MAFVVLVSLKNWLVQEGEVPEPEVGQVLPGIGLRAECWNVRTSTGRDAVVDLDQSRIFMSPTPTEVTGMVTWVRSACGAYESPLEVILHLQEFSFAALGPPTELANVDVGARITVECRLSAMPDFEWEAFALPDVRRDWTVTGIHVFDPATFYEEVDGATSPATSGPGMTSIRKWANHPESDNSRAECLLRLEPA